MRGVMASAMASSTLRTASADGGQAGRHGYPTVTTRNEVGWGAGTATAGGELLTRAAFSSGARPLLAPARRAAAPDVGQPQGDGGATCGPGPPSPLPRPLALSRSARRR